MEVVETVRPDVVLLENVHGIAIEFGKEKRECSKEKRGRKAKPYSVRIKHALEGHGYTVFSELVMAVNYGVPQRRPRYIMIGIRNDLTLGQITNPFEVLKDSRVPFLKSKGLASDRSVSAGEAISNLRATNGQIPDIEFPGFMKGIVTEPVTQYQKLMHEKMGEGDSHRFVNHRPQTVARFTKLQNECRRGVTIRRDYLQGVGLKKHAMAVLDEHLPSRTLTTLPDDLLHYDEPRVLTVREYARLQSFPDWYQMKGKYTTGGKQRKKECPRYSQLGNAVPPLLAEAIGQSLACFLHSIGDPSRTSMEGVGK
jgi:DNA (cytosine-5)-methyltransferase 1